MDISLTKWSVVREKNILLLPSYSIYPLPDSKVHGANMGPTWVLSAPSGPHVGPRNLAILAGFPSILSLWPNDSRWHWRSESSLVQAMFLCWITAKPPAESTIKKSKIFYCNSRKSIHIPEYQDWFIMNWTPGNKFKIKIFPSTKCIWKYSLWYDGNYSGVNI